MAPSRRKARKRPLPLGTASRYTWVETRRTRRVTLQGGWTRRGFAARLCITPPLTRLRLALSPDSLAIGRGDRSREVLRRRVRPDSFHQAQAAPHRLAHLDQHQSTKPKRRVELERA